jgi:hypothetical protein
MYLSAKMIEQIQKKPGNTNFILIYDRSGSMYYDLPKLGEDLIRLSGLLKAGDTLTLSWFSSERGQFRTILKGFRITDNDDVSKVKKIVLANLTSLGCTCFSEVLHDTVTTIQELQVSEPNNSFAMVFFTDGHPVVSNLRAEESSIFQALQKLQPLIGEALFIGYGSYYYREFLSRMASEVGGSLVHADKIADASEKIEILIKDGKASKKVIVDIGDTEDVMLVFGKSTGKIVVYPFSEAEKKAYVSDAEKQIFMVSKKQGKLGLEDEDNVYSTAYALASQNKIDEAIEWLGKVGDKYLIDRLYNSFTTTELGEAINELHAAALDSSKRYQDGKKKNYVPKADAFCLLEALEILIQDKESFFYPTHKDFDYQRTGVPQKAKFGFPKFQKFETCKSPFASLTWNSERLNLSVLTKVEGQIELNVDAQATGLPAFLDTFQWKNYTIIKDGMLNVRKLPCSMSKVAFLALQTGGLIPKTWKWEENKIYILDLKRIPIMNRVIANDYTSATDVANWSFEEKFISAKIKALKYFYDILSKWAEQTTPFSQQFTKEQWEFLTFLGVKPDGAYNPETEKAEVQDFYEANTFQIKVSGWSSLPSVTEVLAKVQDKKKLNAPGEVMHQTFKVYEKEDVTKIKEALEDFKKQLNQLRNKIQRAKFSNILAKKQFVEFPETKDIQTIKLPNDVKVEFVMGKKKVEY